MSLKLLSCFGMTNGVRPPSETANYAVFDTSIQWCQSCIAFSCHGEGSETSYRSKLPDVCHHPFRKTSIFSKDFSHCLYCLAVCSFLLHRNDFCSLHIRHEVGF